MKYYFYTKVMLFVQHILTAIPDKPKKTGQPEIRMTKKCRRFSTLSQYVLAHSCQCASRLRLVSQTLLLMHIHTYPFNIKLIDEDKPFDKPFECVTFVHCFFFSIYKVYSAKSLLLLANEAAHFEFGPYKIMSQNDQK